jgi:hypothetical protein
MDVVGIETIPRMQYMIDAKIVLFQEPVCKQYYNFHSSFASIINIER